jgi:phosphoribosyl 1,2-cyclic phosphodiesterase
MSSGIGLRVWGARGSLPRLSRGQMRHGGNTMCLEIVHPGDEWIILDAGTGIANLGDDILNKTRQASIHLFVSHYHWDHIMGLPFFGPVYQKGFLINLYGLKGKDGYLQDMLEVVFSPFYSPIYSPDNLLGSLSIPAHQHCCDIDGLHITTHELWDIHPGGCLITRVEGYGVSFVYATDVELRKATVIDELIGHCRGVDLLLCDTTFSASRFEEAVGWGHSSLEAAYDVAHRAGVKRLMGIHYDPLCTDDEIETVCRREQGRHSGTTIELAREGETVWL